MISLCTQSYYTHVSIGLEEDLNTFYSFVFKGFIIEKINRYIKPGRKPFPCRLYELEIPEKTYRSIKKKIEFFVAYRNRMRYTFLGVIFSFLHIPYHRKFTYFCSHFVAELLKHAEILPSHKSSSLYLPNDFDRLPGAVLNYQGDLKDMIVTFDISPFLHRSRNLIIEK
ncbi:MAG: hypothetical protein IJC98_03680 [Clostridia bacterium]|nr:hypothetical protein [Clostridia bacterium]